MLSKTINQNSFLSLTEDQAVKLKHSFDDIKEWAGYLEEQILDGMNLPSTMDLLSSRISSIQWDISRSLEESPIRTDEIKRRLMDIGTLSNLMAFLSNVHDGISLLKSHVDCASALLSQENAKGGLSC